MADEDVKWGPNPYPRPNYGVPAPVPGPKKKKRVAPADAMREKLAADDDGGDISLAFPSPAVAMKPAPVSARLADAYRRPRR